LGATSCQLQVDPAWHIVESQSEKGGYGYRFYPDKLEGEGFFIAAVRKEEGDTFTYPKSKRQGIEKLSRKDVEELKGWVKEVEALSFFRHEDMIRALPAALMEDLSYLQSFCYLKKAGVLLGKPSVKEFIPEHELAMSTMICEQLSAVELSREEAIGYLRKDELRMAGDKLQGARGWTLVRYQGQNLGWIKVLPNRINNYYPKEWRILKRP